MKKYRRLMHCSLVFLTLLVNGACSTLRGSGRHEIDTLPGGVTYSDFSSSVPELFVSAREFLELGEFAEAEATYRQIIAAEPDSPHGYIGLGASLYYQDRLADAREAYLQATQLSPPSAMAFIGLGSAAYSQGDFQTAQRAYAAALDLDDTIADAHLGMGLALGELEQYDAAITHLERFLEFAPDTQQRASLQALIAEYESR